MTDERKKEVKEHADKIKQKGFNLVLTNPPFSMSYSVTNTDEERILKQLAIADNSPLLNPAFCFCKDITTFSYRAGKCLLF